MAPVSRVFRLHLIKERAVSENGAPARRVGTLVCDPHFNPEDPQKSLDSAARQVWLWWEDGVVFGELAASSQ